MQRRIPRSALIVACVAALAAVSAGAAQAAITAVTGPAVAVTADSAILTGAVSTGGAATQWQFSYTFAANPFQGAETSGGQLPAGTMSPVPLSDLASGLTPSTTYTFHLIADDDTLGTTSGLLAPIYGAVVTFTTAGPGSASLVSTKLNVKNRRVLVPIQCTNALTCSGGALAITAHHKGKKVACGSATFSVDAGSTRTVSTTKVSATCKALLAAAKNHTISARLTAGFMYQKALSKSVTLTTAK